jgi:hypothetical protein
VTDFLAQVVVWLNAGANALGGILFAPIANLPGWLSATLIAAVTGVVLLLVFKHTSHQRAIKAVRADLKANLLSLKLFRDSTAVVFRAQGQVFWGALRLLLLAVVPILVMIVPVLLIMAQMGLWYQSRPLKVGEEANVILFLSDSARANWPEVKLEPTGAVEVRVGPLRAFQKGEVGWKIRALEAGYHQLVFKVNGRPVDKELAIGDGFMRVSTQRPGWDWFDVLLNPDEEPFRDDSPVKSIEINYPERDSWTSGTTWWIYYWFVISMISALCFRRLFNVHI